jgi:murein DD-endopeptidase MepM/ murein hydrolase activator NlpD
MRTNETPDVVAIDWVKRRCAFSREMWRRDSCFVGRQRVAFGVTLLCVVMLAGCATEGTTRILSYYGSTTGVTGGKRGALHTGVDFDAVKGDPVIAAADGVVTRVTEHNGCVTLEHRMSSWTRYCHMDQIDVTLGQNVKRGDDLGKAGTAGRSMGVPHVHFELWQGQPSRTVDPLPLIVGCFDPVETVASSTRETTTEKLCLVLTYPVRCARRK